MNEQQGPSFKEWCILDLFGHQRAAGLVSQADFPAGFLRIDIPGPDGETAFSQLYSPQAIYSIKPVEAAVAIHVAQQLNGAPVQRWELPQLPAPQEEDDEPRTIDDPFDDDFVDIDLPSELDGDEDAE